MASASSSFTGTENPLSESSAWAATSAYWLATRKANGLGVATLANDCARRYVAATFAADHYSEVTIAIVPSGGQLIWHYTMVRMNTTAGCYMLSTAADVGGQVLQLYNVSNAGVETQIGTNIATGITIAAGSVVRLEVQGTTLTCKLNGTTVRTVTDATWATGQPGCGGYAQDAGSNVLFTSSWAAADIGGAASSPPPRSRTPSYLHSL